MTTQEARSVSLPETITVRELGERLGVSPIEVIKGLMKRGIMANINQAVEFEAAAALAQELGFQVEAEGRRAAPQRAAVRAEEEEDASRLQPRPPVVTVMGHVDHGKTTLLDTIRRTNVAAQEVGGITQHIGAYQVEVDGHKVTFIDTPGHEAFTALRARGAQVTDIAVLVVAADDGVMPQTVEAINHAKAAGVPIIVAINKVDLPGADPERVKRQLSEHGLLIEEWGGDVIALPVSAKTGEGVQDLLEHIILVAELLELKADPGRPAVGTIIESELDPRRGPMATVIVQNGTLRVGEVVVAGETWGRVKALFDEWGRPVKEAGPSTPVKLMGLEEVPRAGDLLRVLPDEAAARQLVEERRRERAAARAAHAITLEELAGQIAAGQARELNLILKADVQGSVEAIRSALERLSSERARVNVLHAATGNVTESDVLLAEASKAIIVAFQVKAEPGALREAANYGVQVRHYQVIYQLIEEMQKALEGLLEPETVEVVEGRAEVRAVFRVRQGRVAGCYVREGTIVRGAPCRVIRDGQVLHTGRIASLRRFQEDVREVATGYECGIGVEGFGDFQEGDYIETFRRQRKG
jgi:translation initiation factor IF-2